MEKATPFFFLFQQKKPEIYLQSFCQGYQSFWRVDQSVACSTEPPQRSCSFQAVKYKASLSDFHVKRCESVHPLFFPLSLEWILAIWPNWHLRLRLDHDFVDQGKGKRPKNQRNKLSLVNSLSSWLVFYLFFSLLKSIRKFVIRVSLGSWLYWKIYRRGRKNEG